ncbi:FAD-dependent oxidoreductase [Novosphingobium sp. KCTC 2891]|uniref:oxidoreductase n=1 Tax=Novosphingobium sp. KCTC 2891 TaxID=2989730 RepID=UPI002221E8DA|nr:FAD-dependent oxidoreductase [Novosphingobium sp. KCTC 2891]MCW1383613.1 FAD-dependent oxidoreductase [Novosphingobium sp. KCTC 2891]
MNYTHVHTPLQIGKQTIKNRIFRPAHGSILGKGAMNDTLIAYHEARARGGAGLSIIEVGSVHPTSPLSIDLWKPELEGGYRKLGDMGRKYDMKIYQQLWHAGHHTLPRDGSPPWGVSATPSVEVGVVPVEMTRPMIAEIIEAYATAARRMEEWGIDGVDVHCAHGYLPAQFLSANTNLREDEYGGATIEERARFVLELMEAVRSAVSRDFVVGVRLAPDLTVGGVDEEQNLAVALMLEERGLIDYVNVSVGNYNSYTKMVGGMHEPVGYELPTSVPITRKVKSPTMVVGRFRTLEECDQIIRAGDADMVGLVRAMIADPDLVTKSLAGKTEEVRPCIGCNQACVAQVSTEHGHMECAVNPGTGHELYRGDHVLQPAAEPKTVLVVGGGPAGMEAARVAALRGHKVTLAEASPTLGGTLRAAAKAPTRHGMIDIATWLEAEIFRLGVDVRLSTYIDADDVVATGAESVIIATGSLPRMDGIQHSHPGQPIRNFDRRNVISAFDLFMQPPANLGKTAVVIDDVGHYEGLAATEYLLEQGLAVTYVTRLRMFAQLAQAPLMVEPFLSRMRGKPFDYLIRHRAVEFTENEVLVSPTHFTDDADVRRLPADTVVFVSANAPNRDLHVALQGRNTDLRIVGDAHSPRFLQTAIREGHMAGASI